MPYIKTPDDIPGIRGLMNFRPDAALALNKLAQALLADDASLTRAERELIASFVSNRNNCKFCMTSHGAIASYLPGCNSEMVKAVWSDPNTAPISEKMKALFHIAGKVQQGGKFVTEKDILLAREAGAVDMDIHDTVLIAAAFCMFNRYVDGLGATTPDDPAFYEMVGKQRATEGYMTKSVLMKDDK